MPISTTSDLRGQPSSWYSVHKLRVVLSHAYNIISSLCPRTLDDGRTVWFKCIYLPPRPVLKIHDTHILEQNKAHGTMKHSQPRWSTSVTMGLDTLPDLLLTARTEFPSTCSDVMISSSKTQEPFTASGSPLYFSNGSFMLRVLWSSSRCTR